MNILNSYKTNNIKIDTKNNNKNKKMKNICINDIHNIIMIYKIEKERERKLLKITKFRNNVILLKERK